MLLARSILLEQMVEFNQCRNMAGEDPQEIMEIADLRRERTATEEGMTTVEEAVVAMEEGMAEEDRGMADLEEEAEVLQVTGGGVNVHQVEAEVMMGPVVAEEVIEAGMEEVDLISFRIDYDKVMDPLRRPVGISLVLPWD